MAAVEVRDNQGPTLSEAAIGGHALPEVIQRGETYWRQGAVGSLVLRGDTLAAEVQGREIEPYQVCITLNDRGGVRRVSCTCRYAWGGWCKHVVAALLTYLNAPEMVEEEPTAEEALAALDGDGLRDLVLRLVGRHPALTEELVLLAEQIAAGDGQHDRPPVDIHAVRQLVRASLRGARRSRAGGTTAIVDEIRQVLQQARGSLAAGDGRAALAILDAVTDEYVHTWFETDDSSGDLGEFFAEIGSAWTEAILSTDLSPDDRKALEKKLAAWQEEVESYGVDEGFEVAAAAARQGWDDPVLVRVLNGDAVENAADEDAEWYFDELTEARLTILRRQGRDEAAEHLAAWAGIET
jgi:uncharacterized Zn finger protein